MALSPRGRISFPSVYQASVVNEGDKPKYSLTLVFNPETMDEGQKALLSTMKAEANRVSQAEFGCDIGGIAKEGGVVKNPFRKTDEKPKFYDPGQYFIRFANKYKPNVVDGRRKPIPEDTADFYAGCWAHVSYEAFAYNYMGNKGVSFSLGNIQKTGDDEPFAGGRTNPEDDFDVIEPGSSSASTEEIPF